MATTNPATPTTSAARERLLDAAQRVFYREGIHAVGVDRVIDEAQVTRATFYRHFPSKQDLVVAYLQRENDQIRALFDSAAAQSDEPRELLEATVAGLAQDVAEHHTRGCPFINASAEFPDAGHPVRQLVREHRDWFRGALEHLLTQAGADDPVGRAATLVLLRDAALVGGYLDGPQTVVPAFTRAARTAAGLTH